MPFVLDASTALAVALPDETSERADRVVERFHAERGIVPALWLLEVANGLVLAERRQRISPGSAEERLNLLLSYPIDVVEASLADVPTIYALARKHGLSAYDATYLNLAIGRRLPLATGDGELRRAARSAGIEVL